VLAQSSPRTQRLGFYVHVPFCVARCHYCSFNTRAMASDELARYLGALHRELDLLARVPWTGRIEIETIFLGGGTPSLLSVDELTGILERIHARVRVAPTAEITVECNPESVSRETLRGYRDAGVNRVSLGVQSTDDAILVRLGRLHTARTAREAFEAARAAGFDNVSVDLMYGLPGLDVPAWRRTLDAVLDWRPEHVSAYGLTLDSGSLWGSIRVDGLPEEETVVAQYWDLVAAAAARGLEHYEISNYARPGFRSRHNQIYWRAGEYLAAGPGACGFVGDLRYQNAKPLARYCDDLEAAALPIESVERLTPRQRLAERLILGLRTADGIPADWLAERVAGDASLRARVEAWRAEGLLDGTAERVRLTERGFLLSDALFVELL
jgi:oxygen-independent coproporphyrinogen-3 oxidase